MLFILFSLSIFAAEDQATVKLLYGICCDDADVTETLSSAIEKRLKEEDLREVMKKPLLTKVVVYASQDKDSKINSDGWAFAIASISNKKTLLLFETLMSDKEIETKLNENIKFVLAHMVMEQGLLKTLNVIHIHQLSAENIASVADEVVKDLVNQFK